MQYEQEQYSLAMSTGIHQPSSRFCFFIAGLLCFKVTAIVSVMLTATDRPEQAIGFLLASPSGGCPEQTCNSNLQLARIHPKHAKPSSSQNIQNFNSV